MVDFNTDEIDQTTLHKGGNRSTGFQHDMDVIDLASPPERKHRVAVMYFVFMSYWSWTHQHAVVACELCVLAVFNETRKV